MLNCGNTHEHDTFEEAVNCVSDYIEDLILDKNYDVGKVSTVWGSFGKKGSDKVNISNSSITYTEKGNCLDRVATRRMITNPEYPDACGFEHNITCVGK